MTFKILSLDGGGIRGVLSVRLLQEFETKLLEKTGKHLHEYFDMIAGTSTGSIIAAGIAKGLTTDKLLKLYENNAKQIFPYSDNKLINSWNALQNIFFKSKYTHDGLIKALSSPEALGDTKMWDISHPILLILAYDMLYRNTTFFTNFHPDLGLRWYDGLPLWKICVSSASAPTFFPPYNLKAYDQEKFGSYSFPHIDGGVCANNPSLAAISQALKLSRYPKLSVEEKKKHNLENINIDNIAVLSIGTGRGGEPYEYEDIQKGNSLGWLNRLFDVFMEPTGEIMATMCKHIMGGFESGRYLRLDFDLNERYKVLENEDYKTVRPVIPAKERKNKFLDAKVNEAMDDGRKNNIDVLIAAAKAYLNKGVIFDSRVYGRGDKVTDAIDKFIAANPPNDITTNQPVDLTNHSSL
jgi:patatin-like phospholipase/acyl hydrolase